MSLNEFLNPQRWIDFIMRILYIMFKYPLELWNKVPWWGKWPVYICIMLFTAFVGWVVWKKKEELRY